jgi:hypothetical protein
VVKVALGISPDCARSVYDSITVRHELLQGSGVIEVTLN